MPQSSSTGNYQAAPDVGLDGYYIGASLYNQCSETAGVTPYFAGFSLDGVNYGAESDGSDPLTAYDQKRGLCSVRVKNGKATIVYFNPFADNNWQTLTVNVDGSSFSGQVYGRRLYAVTVPLTGSPCNFSASVNPSTINTSPNASITLNASCSGSDCSGVNYQWSGNGASNSTSSYTLNAPSSNGTYTYTVTLSKAGCSSSTANVTVNVGTIPPPTNCINMSDLCSGNEYEIRSYNLSLSSGGNKALTLTYRSHSEPGTGRIRINGGAWQQFPLPQTPGDLSYLTTGIGTYAMNSGNNTMDFASVNGGYICLRELCASSSGARLGVAEEPAIEKTELIVSPNPNDGEFEARFFVEPGRQATLQVSDVQGRQIWQKSLKGQGVHREQVRLPSNSVGTYILSLQREATSSASKSEYKRVLVVK